MTTVLLATCAQLPKGDEDSEPLTGALRRLGIDARWQAWDDPAARWDAVTVIRSTWDYAPRREEFLRWAAAVPALQNPYPLVVWNSDKVYLGELADLGIPAVPTVFVRPGQGVRFPDAAEWVVKPSIGAGSRGAGRFRDQAAAAEHVRALHGAGRTAMLQPYLDGVDTAGETALIYLDGEFSHAVVKGAMLPPDAAHAVEDDELFVAERIDARAPSAAECEIGERVVKALTARFGATPLYARIDLLPGPDGPALVEVEVTEPSLFLGYADGAADRFAAALDARL